jgi:hypothetical protein
MWQASYDADRDRDRSGTPVMSAPNQPSTKTSSNSLFRRFAASVILGGLIFLALWLAAFSMVASLLIGSGVTVVVIAGSAVSDLVETVLDVIAAVVFGVFAVIAAIVGAVFSLFN